MAVLALVIATGAGGALSALGAADRTAGAFARYLREADVGDVLINPSYDSTAIDAAIRSLPGVLEVTRDAMLLADIRDGSPIPIAELAEPGVVSLVRGSTDGRFTEMDRPALREGRLPTGTAEAFLTADVADRLGIGVGDTVPIALLGGNIDMTAGPDAVLDPFTEEATVVGIGTVGGEILPDALYPRGQLVLSPDLAARYDCLDDVPPPDVSYEELLDAAFPPGCARTYGYYSVKVEGGAAGVPAVLDAFLAAADRLSADLPPSMLDIGAGYYLIATTTADEQARVERSIQPTVTALRVLAAGAGAVTLVLFGLAAARELRRAQDDVRPWWQLGLGRRHRAVVLVVPLLGAVAAGTAGAIVVAWVASPIAPVGAVRALDPHPARILGAGLVAAGLGLAGAAALLALLLAAGAARRSGAAPPGRSTPGSGAARPRSGRPDVDEGLRAAFASGRGSGLVAASGAVAAGVLVTAVVFGASLTHLVATPPDYGWPWDAAVLAGYGYGRQDAEAVHAALDGHGDVEGWSPLGLSTFTLDGRPLPTVIGTDRSRPLDLTLVEGRLPDAADEVAVGERTATELDLALGDAVTIADDRGGTYPASVTGIVVLPALGPYQADRASPGVGLAVPPAMFGQARLDSYLTFMGLHLAEGADPAAVLAGLDADSRAWSLEGDPVVPLAQPVRPPEIEDAAGMRAVPLVVGGLLTLAATLGLSSAVVVSVRSRRRELGTLRVLGFTGRQLRTSVGVQSVATIVASLAVGIPLGVIAGRVTWRAFAAGLGVATDPTVPLPALAATVAGGLALALAAAAVPARAAARAAAVVNLRSD